MLRTKQSKDEQYGPVVLECVSASQTRSPSPTKCEAKTGTILVIARRTFSVRSVLQRATSFVGILIEQLS